MHLLSYLVYPGFSAKWLLLALKLHHRSSMALQKRALSLLLLLLVGVRFLTIYVLYGTMFPLSGSGAPGCLRSIFQAQVSYLDYYGKLASKILKCTVHHHYHIVNRYDVLVNLIVIICVGLELELHYFQSVDATSQPLVTPWGRLYTAKQVSSNSTIKLIFYLNSLLWLNIRLFQPL